jgi:multiple sugar transport system permease protein
MTALPITMPARRSKDRPAVKDDRGIAWPLLAPALVILALMAVAPAIYLVYVSFRHEDLLGPTSRFVGWANYISVLTDANNWSDGLTTIIFVALAVTIETGLGLGLALLLNRRLPESNFLTALFILPLGIAPVVSALVFRVLLDPAYGWVDYYLQTWGIIADPIDWLGDPVTAWVSIIALDVWQWTPFVTLILLAGLNGVPNEPKEAALLDGAGPIRMFWYITLPFLKPFIVIAVVLRVIEAFKTFGSVYVLTMGGPGTSTELINLDIYRVALQNFDVGAAAALGLIFLAFLALIMGQLLRLLGRNTELLEK